MRLTERDKQMVRLVAEGGALTAEQIQIAANHSLKGHARCYQRLSELVRQHYLSVLPRKSYEKAVFIINRNAWNGMRLLREMVGEEQAKRLLKRRQLSMLSHVLAVNMLWVRTLRMMHDYGYTLKVWQRSDELSTPLQDFELIPDSYWQIAMSMSTSHGAITTRTLGFALEVERTSRDSRVLIAKLKKYRTLYYGTDPNNISHAAYEQLFGIKSLRLLVVFASESEEYDNLRIQTAVKQATKLGVSLAHFTSLSRIQELPPSGLYTEPIWHSPRSAEAVALFPAHHPITAQTEAPSLSHLLAGA